MRYENNCGTGEGQAACPLVLGACGCRLGEVAHPLSPAVAVDLVEASLGPGCLWLARGREAWILDACDWPEE